MKIFPTITALVLLLISYNSNAQKSIFNPTYTSSTLGDIVKITKVSMNDSSTQIDFWIDYEPNMVLPSYLYNSYIIQDKDTLMVKGWSENALTNDIKMNEDGNYAFSMIFPALDTTTKSIDIYSKFCNIYDLQLVKREYNESKLFPQIKGNWLAADGSNNWRIGVYEKAIAWDGKMWLDYDFKEKNDLHVLTLRDGEEQVELYMRMQWDDLWIGTNKDDMQLHRKKKEKFPKSFYPDNGPYNNNVFHQDTAFYHGYIDGYYADMGKTGMIYVNNVISGSQESFLITINEHGIFNATVPMNYPQEVFFRMKYISGTVFLVPGEDLLHYISLPEYTYPYKSRYHRRTRERKSQYMGGECAQINTDLDKMAYMDFFNNQEMRNTILEMSADTYKNYCLKFAKNEKQALESFIAKETINSKALQLMQYKIAFRSWEKVLSYESQKSYAYRVKNKIPSNQRELELEFEALSPAYFSFYDGELVNDPSAITAGSEYYFLVNRTLFAPTIRRSGGDLYIALKDSLRSRNLLLNEEEKVLDKLISCRTREDYDAVFNSDREIVISISKSNKILMDEINKYLINEHSFIQLEKYFGIEKGFFHDIKRSQEFSQKLKSTHMPVADSALELTISEFTNPFIKNYISKANSDLRIENEEIMNQNITKTGFVVNETPDVEGNKIFDEIISRYKGKVVLVDFWATWCGPCRSDMKQLKPLKKEYEDKDIVFLYLTNESSPKKTYDLMVPDIPGEHFRFSQDEWNHVATRFQVSGIPHYTLVNKDGEVVKNGFRIPTTADGLKRFLDPYLEQIINN